MILGNLCTRGCGFCSVPKGSPSKQDMRIDPEEPANVARMAAQMKLRYVVITSVNRDDLADGGSQHFARTVREVRRALPDARVEVLTPDFCGDVEAVARVLDSGPHVFNHNMETVARLYRRVRPDAGYAQSLALIARAARRRDRDGLNLKTKSGLMVGLGEAPDEVVALLGDLRASGCDIATIGQYLQPHERRLPIERYYTPEEFRDLKRRGEALGFSRVESGPLVRSSYHARRALEGPLA
jgi:lipoyl synthase